MVLLAGDTDVGSCNNKKRTSFHQKEPQVANLTARIVEILSKVCGSIFRFIDKAIIFELSEGDLYVVFVRKIIARK